MTGSNNEHKQKLTSVRGLDGDERFSLALGSKI